MKPRDYIDFLNKIEKLKCNTRHSWTSSGRKESIAEHSFRLAVMAMLCKDEYPTLDIDKVIKMCLIHDFGEAVTGDVPAFIKTDEHEEQEAHAVNELIKALPKETKKEMYLLFGEMASLSTPEAKLFKALDNMEALISHNEADISTWNELEYSLNITYGQENAEWSDWTNALKNEIKNDTLKKINESKNPTEP